MRRLLGEDRILGELRLHGAPARGRRKPFGRVPLPPVVADQGDHGCRQDEGDVKRVFSPRDAGNHGWNSRTESHDESQAPRPEVT